MAESIYHKIGKQMGLDVRQVRTVAHHPFEFFNKVMEDPEDHRPMRFRYLGVFFVKPYWRKGLKNVTKVGLPPNDVRIWARVPVQRFNKIYIKLKEGYTKDDSFYSEDYSCKLDKVKFWCLSSKVDELS